MKLIKDKQRRVYEGFANELDIMKTMRIKKGIDSANNKLSDARITRAMLKSPNWGFLKNDVINMPRDKNIDSEFTKLFKTRRNKRGALSDLFVWLIVGFFSLIFFAVWIYAQGLIVTQLQSIPDTTSLNISQATASTFGTVNSALSWLHTISFIIFFGLGLSIIITNIFVKSHPFLFIVYVLFLVATIIFSAYLSNMYDSLLLDSTIGATLQDFTATNFFVLHLPIFVTVMGFIGAITLFINIQRDVELGGGL